MSDTLWAVVIIAGFLFYKISRTVDRQADDIYDLKDRVSELEGRIKPHYQDEEDVWEYDDEGNIT